MRFNKRLVSLLMLLVIAVTAFSACGKPDETEVIEAFKTLYEKSVTVNEYVYGNGLPSDTAWDEKTAPQYEAVSEGSPYKSRAELEKAGTELLGF